MEEPSRESAELRPSAAALALVPSLHMNGTNRSYIGSTHEAAHEAAEAAGETLRPDLRMPRGMQEVYFDGYDVFDEAKGTRRFVGCLEGHNMLRYNPNATLLSRALVSRLRSERASYAAAEELFVHEIKRASSADAPVDLARRTIGSPEGLPPEVIWQSMGDHPRRWKQRLIDQDAFRVRSADAPATGRTSRTAILKMAANLVRQLRPINSFISAMSDGGRRYKMRRLIIDGGLAATSSAGLRLFVSAMDRRLPRPCSLPQFLTDDPFSPTGNPLSRIALSWLLEFPDVPTSWLDDLAGAWADDSWMVGRIAEVRSRQA